MRRIGATTRRTPRRTVIRRMRTGFNPFFLSVYMIILFSNIFFSSADKKKKEDEDEYGPANAVGEALHGEKEAESLCYVYARVKVLRN